MLEELSSTWGKLNALIWKKTKTKAPTDCGLGSQDEAVNRQGVKPIKCKAVNWLQSGSDPGYKTFWLCYLKCSSEMHRRMRQELYVLSTAICLSLLLAVMSFSVTCDSRHIKLQDYFVWFIWRSQINSLK